MKRCFWSEEGSMCGARQIWSWTGRAGRGANIHPPVGTLTQTQGVATSRSGTSGRRFAMAPEQIFCCAGSPIICGTWTHESLGPSKPTYNAKPLTLVNSLIWNFSFWAVFSGTPGSPILMLCFQSFHFIEPGCCFLFFVFLLNTKMPIFTPRASTKSLSQLFCLL